MVDVLAGPGETAPMNWIPVCSSEALAPGAATLARHGAARIAVLRLDDGTLCAVDNRCPHEGYPLQQGTLKGPVLTCCWHNYKFDARTGACLMGDEDVATFPVREVDGRVEVDPTPPPAGARRERIWPSLGQALRDRDNGRIARDLLRLLDAGAAPAEVVRFGVEWDARHGEYGPSHGLPTLVDALDLLEQPGRDAALELAHALDVTAEANLRRPPRVRAEPRPGDAADLLAAVEAEDVTGAEGIVRHMVAAGATVDALEAAVLPLAAVHHLDFGHGLIFTVKAFALARRQPLDLDLVLGALVAGLTTGTREEALPPWAGWRHRLATVDLAALDRGDAPLAVDALVDADARESFARLGSGVRFDSAVAALTHAAAERLLRFDADIDLREGVQDGWLDVTHRLTVADAVRQAGPRLAPELRWRLLLMAGHFVATARAYDGPRPAVDPTTPDPEALGRALARRDAAAVGHAAALLADGRVDELDGVIEAWIHGDVVVRGIFYAHLLKTWMAARAAWALTGDPLPVLAVVRWFAEPMAERRVNRRLQEARRLLVDGLPPKRLVD